MNVVVEAQNIVGNTANQTGQSTIDVLQQLLELEMQKKVSGSVKVRFLLDGGFEGDLRIDVRSVQVRADKNKLKIAIDGVNGEIELEVSK